MSNSTNHHSVLWFLVDGKFVHKCQDNKQRQRRTGSWKLPRYLVHVNKDGSEVPIGWRCYDCLNMISYERYLEMTGG